MGPKVIIDLGVTDLCSMVAGFLQFDFVIHLTKHHLFSSVVVPPSILFNHSEELDLLLLYFIQFSGIHTCELVWNYNIPDTRCDFFQLIFLSYSFQFGIILIVIIVLQVLEILGLLMLLLLRESVLNAFLKELMDRYYDDVDDREIMDSIQTKVRC